MQANAECKEQGGNAGTQSARSGECRRRIVQGAGSVGNGSAGRKGCAEHGVQGARSAGTTVQQARECMERGVQGPEGTVSGEVHITGTAGSTVQ